MATRSQQYRAESERTGAAAKKKTPKRRPKAKGRTRSAEHEAKAKKATYAAEETNTSAKKSRKSTRKSANRRKPDASLTTREELVKNAPQARAKKSARRASRVRGKAAG